MFKMRQLLLQKHKRELSEYKAIGMIQDHLSLLYQAIQRNTRIITKVLIRLFTLLKKNGRKSHRYEKKTIFEVIQQNLSFNEVLLPTKYAGVSLIPSALRVAKTDKLVEGRNPKTFFRQLLSNLEFDFVLSFL